MEKELIEYYGSPFELRFEANNWQKLYKEYEKAMLEALRRNDDELKIKAEKIENNIPDWLK